jgi:hypothetical protein
MGIKDVYNAATLQWAVLIDKYPKLYFLILVLSLIVATVLITRTLTKAGKLGFQNKSMYGYYYETSDLSFPDRSNRQLANQALQTQLNKYNYSLTLEQLDKIPSSIVLSFLELEDDEVDPIALVAKIVMMTDPTYDAVRKSVDAAIRNSGVFASADERSAVYDLLTKYFIAIKQPLGIPLANWSDAILIQTFKSLKAPTVAQITASPPATAAVANTSASTVSSGTSSSTTASSSTLDAMTVTPSPLFTSVGSV